MKALIPCLCLTLNFASANCLNAQGPSYAKDVRPFLDKYCVECHKGNKASRGVKLESYESFISASRKGRKLVAANDADKSLLLNCVEGTGGRKMPPKKASKQPTAKEISVLRDWINAGAKDDTTTKEPPILDKDKQDTEKKAGNAKADPVATKLLADSRAARAQWEKFPGFTADVEINFDGKVSQGVVKVEATGKVSCVLMVLTGRAEKLDGDAEAWAKRQLGSIVAHRIDDSASLNTPCAFSDGEANHPLGRAITVLSDELHSSYRVRDRQIIVVNRQMKDSRFSITVLENRTNKEGKFLPASYVVHYWDTKTGDLEKTESHLQTWIRVEGFDLPVTAQVITATKNLSTRNLTLTNHKVGK